MEEQRIKFEDIFAEDIFQRAATSAKALNEVLKELDETLKKIAKENAEVIKSLAGAEKSAQNLQKLAQATQQAEQAVRSSVQVSKERARIEQKLKELTTQEARELALLSQHLRRLRSETEAQAKAADILARSQQLVEKATKNSFESYKDLSDTLADLRSLYKDLAAAGKGDTDEAKQLLSLVQQLDRRVKELDANVGQFQRNVGNYQSAVEGIFKVAGEGAEKAGRVIGGLTDIVKGMGNSFVAAGGGIRGAAAAVSVLGGAIKSSGVLLVMTLLGGVIGKVVEKLQKGVELLTDFLGITAGAETLRQAQEALAATVQRLGLEREVTQARLERALVDADERRTAKERLEAAEKELDAQEKLLRYDIQRLQSQKAQAEAELAAAGAFTTATTKAELLTKMQEAIVELAGKEAELLDLQNQRRILALQYAQQLAELEAQRRARLEELLRQLELEQEKAKTRVEAIRRERDERLRSIEAIRAEALALAASAAEREEVARRYAARRAQIIAQAELEIAEVRAEARERAAELYLQVAEKTLDAELAAIGNRYRELARQVQALEAELGEELTGLRQELAAAEVRERVRARRAALEREAAERERAAAELLDLEARNFDDERAFAEYKEKKLTEIKLNAVRERIAALQKLNEQIKDEETEALIRSLEAQEALLELRLRSLTKTQENYAEKLKQIYAETGRKIAEALDLVEALLDRAEQRASRRLEREAARVSRRIDLLIAQVERGSDSAQDSIAALERREAEIVRAQEELKKRAQRREAALGAFRTYAAQLQQGVNPAQALLNTLRDLTLITQAIRALPVFHAGTEYVRPAVRPIAGAMQDTVLARLHPGERVVPADINRQLAGIPNEDLPKLPQSARVEVDVDSILNAMRVVIRKGNRTDIYKRAL